MSVSLSVGQISVPVQLLVRIGLWVTWEVLEIAALLEVVISVSSGRMFRWLQFLRNLPVGVCTMYDWGVSDDEITWPGVGCLSVVIQTSVFSGICFRSWTRWWWSWSIFCLFLNTPLSFLSCSKYGHMGTKLSVVCGRLVRIFVPMRSSDGDLLHQGKGVDLYESSTRCGSPAFLVGLSLSSLLSLLVHCWTESEDCWWCGKTGSHLRSLQIHWGWIVDHYHFVVSLEYQA